MDTKVMTPGKARKLWRDFPFLWSILHDWSAASDVRVTRLDAKALSGTVGPRAHHVFILTTKDPRGDGWGESLKEILFTDLQTMCDTLYNRVQMCESAGNRVDAVIVCIRTMFDEARYVTVYKPPRGMSIHKLLQREFDKLPISKKVGLQLQETLRSA
ncbi:MAG: hypothetical protein A3D67_03040 [Candidatus Lloydbacteria bacterium RIFCSPHIGHO2_02_FULL_51_22]|uniref:Uncharacterized protein n=1 Tax=Candidatus Lloydbacteria bacterium RIFCSPHIGHO2_02_FULL_51_22 TaxID=1798663 RepID=A0A1G2D907_9BACT|nr:MAG: hypothetical protein A3D67_03040 [Candidatus Lloydbacteria bacterium RIFCSPHIGHO2_02_FULL_51_22]